MRGHRRGQQGAILVLTAFLLPFIILFTGFAVDAGNAYMHHSKLQNSADAAVLAGAHKYAENKSKPDTQAKVEEYMKLNQGDTPYKVDPPVYTEKDKTHTKITVHASQELPTFFLGAAYKLLSKAFNDESLDKWDIRVTASALISEDSNKDDSTGLFDYAMIGGYNGYPSDKHSNVGGAEWNEPIYDSLIFNKNDIYIKGKVHANGPVYLPVMDSKNGTYPVYVEQFTCAASHDRELWSNYKDNYADHYKTGHYGIDEEDAIEIGHKHDDLIVSGPEDNPTKTWRFYARLGTFDPKNPSAKHEDYTAEGSHTDIVDTTMRDVNPLTAPIRDLINQYSKMSLADREKNHIYLETDGNYTALWTKRHNPPIKTYQLNPSHDKSIYPGITSTDFQFSNTNESWRVWDSVYKIIIVDGNLNVNIPAEVKPSDPNDHVLLISLHGDIHLQNGSDFYGYVYAPQGTVWLDGTDGSTIYGSIIGSCIKQTSKINIVHKKFGGTDSGAGNKPSNKGTPKIYLVSDDA